MTYEELLEAQRKRRRRLLLDMLFRWGHGPIPQDWDMLQFVSIDYHSRMSNVEKLVRIGGAQ